MGENDDKGRPPYVDENKLEKEQYDYLWQWMDYYTHLQNWREITAK